MSEHLLVRKRKCCCLLNLQAPKAGSALLGNDAMLKLVREFQNAVERNQWRSVAFTADSEHLAAAAHSKTEHIIYIWNREFGNLTRILEGFAPDRQLSPQSPRYTPPPPSPGAPLSSP